MSVHVRAWLMLSLLALATPARADAPPPAAAAPASPSHTLPLAFERHHTLGRAKARERVRELLEYWAERFGVQRAWQGDTARIVGRLFGVNFEAKLVVGDSQVSAEASDPGFFLRGPAIDYINRKLGKYLHPQYQES
jgi:Putative polyhydroxyalkanoic acid system protein (PHA_gran_rgn)